MAVLLQPVVSQTGRGMAVVQVAETLELRRTLARQILVNTIWRQALLVAVIALVAVVVIQRGMRPVRRLSGQLQARTEGDLKPITAPDAPRELLPLVDATNQVMTRLAHLLDNQKRFVRDTAHQLRTPLAVLKTQVQSALHGDLEPRQALAGDQRHGRSRNGAGQPDAGAGQGRTAAPAARRRPHRPGRSGASMALELSPLIAEKDLDFEIATAPAPVQAHEWMLRELTRNLLHNAIRHSPGRRPLDRAAGQGRQLGHS